jgi:hypothetical protein
MNLEHMREVVREAQRVAGYGTYRGMLDDKYLKRCTHRDEHSQVLLSYTRDVDPEFKRYSEADGALHLSMSPLPVGQPRPAPLGQAVVFAWVAAFFGDDFTELWFELAKTKLGQRFQVLHARRLTRQWLPLVGSPSRGLAQRNGWLRATDLSFPLSLST